MGSGTVADAVAATLHELGVEAAFGLVGSGNFHVTNGLVARGVRFAATRHEGAAVSAADAYARVTGRVGVCTVHQGPGVTNLVTGLAEAAKSRTPLLVLAADSPAAALRSNFRIDQALMAASVDALNVRADSPERAVAAVVEAHALALSRRRPVLLTLPIDVQGAPAGDAALMHRPPGGPVPPAPDPAQVTAVADLLAGAQRPLLIAGRGAVIAGARPALDRLARGAGALLATSAAGHGLLTGLDGALGISGGFAAPFAANLIHEADVVVAFGAGLNMWTTRHGRLLGEQARVVQVDVEADGLGAHRPVELGVVADAGLAAEAIAAELERRGHRPGTWRTPELVAEIRARTWAAEPFADQSTADRIDPRTLSRALDGLLPDERQLVVDSGHYMGWPVMHWRIPDERAFIFTQAFQAVGLGLGSAIGAAVARPGRLTVAAVGDGGLLMAAGELETISRLGLPMLVVVYNDAAYGAEVHHFGPDGEPVDIVRFPDADLAALARAAGMEGLTLRRPADLEPVRDWLGRRERPLLVDAKVVPTVVGEWLSEAFGH